LKIIKLGLSLQGRSLQKYKRETFLAIGERMGLSIEHYQSRTGILKLLAIVVGIVTLGFIASSYYRDGKDQAYLSCVIICFIISFLFMLVRILNVIHESEMLNKVEFLFHVLACIFYLVTLICFLVSLIYYSTKGRKRWYPHLWQRIMAFIFGCSTCALYGLVSLFHFQEHGV